MLSRLLQAWHIYWRLRRQPNASPWIKWLPFALLAYVLWPVDVLPDPLPLLGMLDDLALILSIGYWLWQQIAPYLPKEKGVIDVAPLKKVR